MEAIASSAPQASYDVIVIGGGPGGSTAASILAEGGRSVLVLEAAKFPRFAVGEIVAPTGLWRVWHRLGITQETLDDLFVRKWAGGWQAPDGTIFTFDQDVHPDDKRCRAFVYTFERAVYDDFLLRHASTTGAEVREEALVEDILQEQDGRVTGVRFRDAGGVHEVRSDLVIDASGRQNILGRRLKLRMDLVELKSFSVFAHYVDAVRNTGQTEGDVRIVFGENMWFWWAPLK
ncbi:MAG TPA: tryptophan 7-halogenase, partial [Thermoanaerobaculia bacterium]|nr:tryptophan 7-halogenase [Thermoanaerobaculia bacterium]